MAACGWGAFIMGPAMVWYTIVGSRNNDFTGAPLSAADSTETAIPANEAGITPEITASRLFDAPLWAVEIWAKLLSQARPFSCPMNWTMPSPTVGAKGPSV